MVEPLEQKHDGYGADISERLEWTATARGRNLRPPTGLSLNDIVAYVTKVVPPGTKLASAVVGLAIYLAPLLGLALPDGDATRSRVGAGVVVAFCVLASAFLGLRADGQLRAAAKAWKRLGEKWPKTARWQRNGVRPWLEVVALLAYFGFLPVMLIAPGAMDLGLALLLLAALIYLGLFAREYPCARERGTYPLMLLVILGGAPNTSRREANERAR